MSMKPDHDAWNAIIKVTIAWVLAGIGAITLQQIATVLAILYTSVQLYVLVRDKIIRRAP